jgi:hypothetical protein
VNPLQQMRVILASGIPSWTTLSLMDSILSGWKYFQNYPFFSIFLKACYMATTTLS